MSPSPLIGPRDARFIFRGGGSDFHLFIQMEKSMEAEHSLLFFSYVRADAGFALKLAESLRSAGVHLWIDQLDIRAGDHGDQAAEQALTISESLLIIFSPDAVESKRVMAEVFIALSKNKRIVPVLYKPCKIPYRLERLSHVDFTGDFDRGLERLLSDLAIKSAPADRLPQPYPPAPEKKETQQTQPVGIPRAIPAKSRPHEPARPKPGALKKRNILLIGVMIGLALAIVIGWALWFFLKP